MERAERIWATVAAAAELLRGRYGATRVAVFGSLVSGDVGPDSDLDLAVEGVTPETYFEALADVMDIAQAGVDLVRLETAAPSLIARIEETGLWR